MYENIKISDSCPKDKFNYESYYDIPIITPRNSIAFQVRKMLEEFIRSKCSPGVYRDHIFINTLLKKVFSFLDNQITTLVKKLSCKDFIYVLLDEYTASWEIQKRYTQGIDFDDEERWQQRRCFRRSSKYLIEKMLENFDASKNIDIKDLISDFEFLIELTELAFDFSIQSDSTYGISRKRTIFKLFEEHSNPYYQYYDFEMDGFDLETFNRAKFLFPQFVEKKGSLHKNIISEYISATSKEKDDKECLFFAYFITIFNILKQATGTVLIPKLELKNKLISDYGIHPEAFDLFLNIFSINKEGLRKEPRFLYETKQKYRLKMRFIIEIELDNTTYLIFTPTMLEESRIFFHKSLCYNDFSCELQSKRFKEISAQITRSYGKKFEVYATNFLKTKDFVGCVSKRRLPSGNTIPNDVGEIDFLGYSKDQQRVACFEFKNVFYSTDPQEFRDDLDKFIRKKNSYLSKFKKKIDFVKAHIEDLTEYYRQKDAIDLSTSQIIVGMLTYAPNISRFFMTDCKCMSLAEFEVDWAQNPEQFFMNVVDD